MEQASSIDEEELTTTSEESVKILHQLQERIIAGNPPADQAFCIAAEFLVWVLLCASDTGDEAVTTFGRSIESIVENIRDNAPAMMGRKKLLGQLNEVPQWVN